MSRNSKSKLLEKINNTDEYCSENDQEIFDTEGDTKGNNYDLFDNHSDTDSDDENILNRRQKRIRFIVSENKMYNYLKVRMKN